VYKSLYIIVFLCGLNFSDINYLAKTSICISLDICISMHFIFLFDVYRVSRAWRIDKLKKIEICLFLFYFGENCIKKETNKKVFIKKT